MKAAGQAKCIVVKVSGKANMIIFNVSFPVGGDSQTSAAPQAALKSQLYVNLLPTIPSAPGGPDQESRVRAVAASVPSCVPLKRSNLAS